MYLHYDYYFFERESMSQKVENLLNLALDASDNEREITAVGSRI